MTTEEILARAAIRFACVVAFGVIFWLLWSGQ
jgi:hypothetical protein